MLLSKQSNKSKLLWFQLQSTWLQQLFFSFSFCFLFKNSSRSIFPTLWFPFQWILFPDFRTNYKWAPSFPCCSSIGFFSAWFFAVLSLSWAFSTAPKHKQWDRKWKQGLTAMSREDKQQFALNHSASSSSQQKWELRWCCTKHDRCCGTNFLGLFRHVHQAD